MRQGQRPDPEALVGAEYQGANTARWTSWLRMQQFIKGFDRRPDGRVFGYNRRVEQDGLHGGWSAPSDRFGFFEVRNVDASSRDRRYPHALLLDYGAGDNPRLDPSRAIRDYLVRAKPDSDELLLGRAFLSLGPLRPSPTYFVIERARA
jgi:hypothetical protein